jgi:hypothetical protein
VIGTTLVKLNVCGLISWKKLPSYTMRAILPATKSPATRLVEPYLVIGWAPRPEILMVTAAVLVTAGEKKNLSPAVIDGMDNGPVAVMELVPATAVSRLYVAVSTSFSQVLATTVPDVYSVEAIKKFLVQVPLVGRK